MEDRLIIYKTIFVLLISTTSLYAQDNLRDRIRERIKERIGENSLSQPENYNKAGKVISTPGDYDFSLQIDGLERTYKVHIPKAYEKTIHAPLILAFHGGGGNSEIMANDTYYHLISKSEKKGFIIAFPNGASRLSSGKLATWNAGNCCGYARDSHSDDVGFVKAVISDLQGKLAIDSKKIYAIGMSNGGMFCYRLACDLTDKFRAIASVAGSDNYDGCNPQKSISIIHIHARDDGHVLFNGGSGGFRDETKVTNFTSVPETISRWVKRDNCNSVPKRVLAKEGVYCDLYTGCDNNTQVMLCVTEKGGHSWPGSQKPREKADTPSNAISAVDTIWDFFKSQSLE